MVAQLTPIGRDATTKTNEGEILLVSSTPKEAASGRALGFSLKSKTGHMYVY